TAEQGLCSGASDQLVVSVSAGDRRRDCVGEDTVALVDLQAVVAIPAIDDDVRDGRSCEAEIGQTVVAEVDLEDARLPGLQQKRGSSPYLGGGARERCCDSGGRRWPGRSGA